MGSLKSTFAALATAVTLATGPVYSAEKEPTETIENVTKQTRQKVVQLKQQFPNFKLSAESQDCLDGKIIDPECDPTIVGEVSLYRNQQELNASKQELNASKQELNASKQELNTLRKENEAMVSTRDNISIVLGLVQLGLYIDYEKIPPKNADYMDIVMSNPNTPHEVKSLFEEFLKRKKSGSKFTWKNDGKRLIDLANKHLQIANTLQGQLKDETYKQQAAAMYAQATQSFTMGKQMLEKKV